MALASGTVLGRSDVAVVVLRSLTVYSTGFVVDVAMRLKRSERQLERDVFTRQGMERDSFEIAVELADGSRFAGSALPAHSDAGAAAGIALQRGNGNTWGREISWWIWPLPPADGIALITTWPAYAIAPTRTPLDAAAIRAAARRSTRFFD